MRTVKVVVLLIFLHQKIFTLSVTVLVLLICKTSRMRLLRNRSPWKILLVIAIGLFYNHDT